MQPLSVTTLTYQIKSLLETSFSRVSVKGELSRITYHNSGHIYFTLKDGGATIRAVMFRGNAKRLRFVLEEGIEVIIDASITLYTPRGEYQLNCFSIEPSGKGALAFAFEQLKNKLSSLGYFDQNRKKPLPKFPKKVALITSATGAALQDMLRVATSRYPLVEFDIYDVLVQGESAAASIANAIAVADKQGYDAIVIGRGGGSIEDMWAFNEEIVADALFAAKTPIISAVGHEIDTVISDFVADVRAATPSNAMEILLPDKTELLLYVDTLYEQYLNRLREIYTTKAQTLRHLYEAFKRHSIEKKINTQLENISSLKAHFHQSIELIQQRLNTHIKNLKERYPEAIDALLSTKSSKITSLKEAYEASDPKKKSKKGYAQIVVGGKVASLNDLKVGEVFEVQTAKTILTAKALKKTRIS